MYKMYLMSAKGYKNAKIDFLTIIKTSEIWVNIISDLVLKEIYGICET